MITVFCRPEQQGFRFYRGAPSRGLSRGRESQSARLNHWKLDDSVKTVSKYFTKLWTGNPFFKEKTNNNKQGVSNLFCKKKQQQTKNREVLLHPIYKATAMSTSSSFCLCLGCVGASSPFSVVNDRTSGVVTQNLQWATVLQRNNIHFRIVRPISIFREVRVSWLQKDFGSILFRLFSLLKGCGLWTLSCDFAPHS